MSLYPFGHNVRDGDRIIVGNLDFHEQLSTEYIANDKEKTFIIVPNYNLRLQVVLLKPCPLIIVLSQAK